MYVNLLLLRCMQTLHQQTESTLEMYLKIFHKQMALTIDNVIRTLHRHYYKFIRTLLFENKNKQVKSSDTTPSGIMESKSA